MENQGIIMEEIKSIFEEYPVETTCSYEGCGNEDGWPSFHPGI